MRGVLQQGPPASGLLSTGTGAVVRVWACEEPGRTAEVSLNMMRLNHPKSPLPPRPCSRLERLSSTEPVPGAKKAGDRCLTELVWALKKTSVACKTAGRPRAVPDYHTHTKCGGKRRWKASDWVLDQGRNGPKGYQRGSWQNRNMDCSLADRSRSIPGFVQSITISRLRKRRSLLSDLRVLECLGAGDVMSAACSGMAREERKRGL